MPKHLTLLTILATILFISLGTWQINRAEEKKTRLAQAQFAEQQLPTAWQSHPLPNAYQRLKVTGQYLDTLLLLDNQHEQHRLGYHVLTPLVLENQPLLIIDRGWIPKEQVAQIKTPKQALTITGQAYYPSNKQWVLGTALEIKSPQLAFFQILDTQLISQFLQKSVYPFIIRLDAQEPDGFVRHWMINNMPWQRHIAYAIQWFAFGLIVIILYFIRMSKHEKK